MSHHYRERHGNLITDCHYRALSDNPRQSVIAGLDPAICCKPKNVMHDALLNFLKEDKHSIDSC